jgi:hypothetical protein
MRTTIDLNDRLLTVAKQAAAKRGITLREIFEQALGAYLEPMRKVEGYKLELGLTRGEAVSGVPIDDWSEMRRHVDDLETERDRDRYRK